MNLYSKVYLDTFSLVLSAHCIDSVFRLYSTEVLDTGRRPSSHVDLDLELHDTNALRRGEVQVKTHCQFSNAGVKGK